MTKPAPPLINSDFRRFREGEMESLTNQITALQDEVTQNGAMGAGKIMANFARYARTMDITRLLVFYEVYKNNQYPRFNCRFRRVAWQFAFQHGALFGNFRASELLKTHNRFRHI